MEIIILNFSELLLLLFLAKKIRQNKTQGLFWAVCWFREKQTVLLWVTKHLPFSALTE